MTTQIAKRPRRPPRFGTLSVAAPFIGAFLSYVLLSLSASSEDSPVAFLLGLLLFPLSLLSGVAFAASAWIRRERFWLLPSIGLLINLALVLWIVLWVTSPGWPFAGDPLEVFYRHSNPVEAWKGASQEPNPTIDKDYHDFITKLSLPPGNFISQQGYLEDGKGQHAITIEVGRDGTYWTYVLIYDQNSQRIKVIKYISGHYAC
jgi:hypothetical protein